MGSINRNVLPSPLNGPLIEADSTGSNLIDYTGGDDANVTVCGELNKLASNIAIGRDWAGVPLSGHRQLLFLHHERAHALSPAGQEDGGGLRVSRPRRSGPGQRLWAGLWPHERLR